MIGCQGKDIGRGGRIDGTQGNFRAIKLVCTIL